jgi:hypothetical protein
MLGRRSQEAKARVPRGIAQGQCRFYCDQHQGHARHAAFGEALPLQENDMNNTATAIREAAERGGYGYRWWKSNDIEDDEGYNALPMRALTEHLQDPTFWKALGEARSWQDTGAWLFTGLKLAPMQFKVGSGPDDLAARNIGEWHGNTPSYQSSLTWYRPPPRVGTPR